MSSSSIEHLSRQSEKSIASRHLSSCYSYTKIFAVRRRLLAWNLAFRKHLATCASFYSIVFCHATFVFEYYPSDVLAPTRNQTMSADCRSTCLTVCPRPLSGAARCRRVVFVNSHWHCWGARKGDLIPLHAFSLPIQHDKNDRLIWEFRYFPTGQYASTMIFMLLLWKAIIKISFIKICIKSRWLYSGLFSFDKVKLLQLCKNATVRAPVLLIAPFCFLSSSAHASRSLLHESFGIIIFKGRSFCKENHFQSATLNFSAATPRSTV